MRLIYTTSMPSPSSQHGGIFTYILIGIVLFAALGYAISQNNIKTDFVSDEKARLIATELIAQGNAVKDTVSKMRLRGIKRTELSVVNTIMTSATYNNSNCTSATCKIFDPAGGNISFPMPIAGATNTPDTYWGFYNNLSIQDLDTVTSEGYRSRIFMMLADVNQKVCRQINNLLHGVDLNTDLAGSVNAPGGAPWDGTLYTGPYAMGRTQFLPLTSSKDDACMPYTTNWFFWKDITATSNGLSLPAGKHYYYIVTLSPSR